jgi:pimeloyl-ACP methyl ester carboxylesterase
MLGYGKSDKPTDVDAYGLREVVSGLASLLDQLGIQRLHVVGHDWGASVAWRMATTLPQRVKSLVVLSVGHPGTGGGMRTPEVISVGR